MCETCGCGVTSAEQHQTHHHGGSKPPSGHATETVEVLEALLAGNDRQAAHNRAHFDRHGVLAINLMSSPGAGKTALLEATIDRLGEELRIAVIEGDLETENDARRIRARGAEARQITTGTACHLDAHMVHAALHELALERFELVFIENVGNLVCPASFDLGQHYKVTLLSVPEGDDKPAKYPVMFRAAELVLLTKTDLLPWIGEFDPARAEAGVRALANPAPVLQLSARDGSGLEAWLGWLRQALAAQAAQRATAGRVRSAGSPGRAERA